MDRHNLERVVGIWVNFYFWSADLDTNCNFMEIWHCGSLDVCVCHIFLFPLVFLLWYFERVPLLRIYSSHWTLRITSVKITSVKMTTSVNIENFSWYTDKKWFKGLKNSTNCIKKQTHMESVIKTKTGINGIFSAEEAKSIRATTGKKNNSSRRAFRKFLLSGNRNERPSEIRKRAAEAEGEKSIFEVEFELPASPDDNFPAMNKL